MWNEKNVVAAIILPRARYLRKKVTDLLRIESPDDHFAVPSFGLRVARSVDGQSNLVHIALELEASLFNKGVVIGIPVARLLSQIGKRPHRLQIGIEDAIALRQQSHRLRRRPQAYEHSRRQQRQHDRHSNADSKIAPPPNPAHKPSARRFICGVSRSAARGEK